jgi:hypothetical protein
VRPYPGLTIASKNRKGVSNSIDNTDPMEIIAFAGWPNCIRLSNKDIELIITTDVGPRILRCGFIKGQNLLYVSREDKGRTGGTAWRIYGGHRLWHAPEEMPRTYFPDNNPVDHFWDGKTLKLTQEIETTTGIVKEMEITLDPDKNQVKLLHRLINRNLWTIETSPWAITAHAPGGKAILPQEPYIDPEDFLLPARPVVLWHYTHMTDPRWTWGDQYIQLLQDPARISEQKIGVLNKQGWSAYCLRDDLMIKCFGFDPQARYADYGCNNELYANGNLLEIETLGPVQQLLPGQATEHTECWLITNLGNSLQADNLQFIDRLVRPLAESFYTQFTGM